MLLLVDVNGNYTVDLALESMRRIAPYGVHFYEEPLPPQDFRGYELLAARAPIPVATGEALYTVWDFARLIEARAVDVVQPDLTLCGGLDQARPWRCSASCTTCASRPTSGAARVGLAAAVHFVAALPAYPHTDNVPAPCLIEYDVGDNPLRDELLTSPLAPVNGRLAVPDAPGLGIELDPEAIKRFRLRR